MNVLSFLSMRRTRQFAIAMLSFASIAIAQTSLAAPRGYYMSFFTAGGNRTHSSLSYAYADIHYFWFGAKVQQPMGQSILALDYIDESTNPHLDPASNDFKDQLRSLLQARQFDWSRIAAVLIDEPYSSRNAAAPAIVPPIDHWSRPCSSLGMSDPRAATMAATSQYLRKVSEVVSELSQGTTLFWVNFSEPEIQWMMQGGGCGVPIYETYLNVISLDKYKVPFGQPFLNGCAEPFNYFTFGSEGQLVQPYYYWLVNCRLNSQQKIALVPGLFHETIPSNSSAANPATVASWLDGYFAYANSVNGNCIIDPWMRNGRGNGCRVWLVAGWRAGVNQECETTNASGECVTVALRRIGLFEPSAQPILNRWKQEVGVTRATVSSLGPIVEYVTRRP